MQPKGVRVSSPSHPSPESPHQRLRVAREQAGFSRASDAARAMGIEEPTYLGHENGSRGLSRAAPRYARFFGVSLDWLILLSVAIGVVIGVLASQVAHRRRARKLSQSR